MPFTTYDRSGGNDCAAKSGGGFWYLSDENCYQVNPTGQIRNVNEMDSSRCKSVDNKWILVDRCYSYIQHY